MYCTCIYTHSFNILFEREEVIGAVAQGFPAIVDGVAEHSEGVDVTLLAAGAREDELGGKEVQGGVGV